MSFDASALVNKHVFQGVASHVVTTLLYMHPVFYNLCSYPKNNVFSNLTVCLTFQLFYFYYHVLCVVRMNLYVITTDKILTTLGLSLL